MKVKDYFNIFCLDKKPAMFYSLSKMDLKKSFMLGIMIPPEWNDALDRLAEQEYLSKSDIVRRAIKEYLDKHQANVSPDIHRDMGK